MLDRAGLLTDDIGRTIYDLLLEEDLLDLNVISIGAQLDARRQTGGSEAALAGMNSRRVLDRRRGFDLIAAADVLVYFGALGELLSAFGAAQPSGGWLVFSCERATLAEAPLGWMLRASGRFAHTREYVVAQARAAGYLPAEYAEIVPRMESGVAVLGHLFVFERVTDGTHATRDEL